MKSHVTIVPSDKLIMVDGHALRFDFGAPANLHAVQWHEGSGHMEFSDDLNHPLSGEAMYAEEVAPFVALWQAEKDRLLAEEAEAEARKLAELNSEAARAARVRSQRDAHIAATDYLMAVDYPLSNEQRVVVVAYRQALRDLPAQSGFPWDGGGADTPWPVVPEMLRV